MDPLLTTAEVAALYGVSVRTVHRMRVSGELKAANKLATQTGTYQFRPAAVARAFARRADRKVPAA